MGADARPQALLASPSNAVMLAYLRFPAFPAMALLALVGADARPQALLAPVMLAYLRSPAFLALAFDALVKADSQPHTLLALAPAAVMLAYLRSAAFLALALDALVGADAHPQALPARCLAAVMLAYVRSFAFLALAFFMVVLTPFAWHDEWSLLADYVELCSRYSGPWRVVTSVDFAGPGECSLGDCICNGGYIRRT